MKRSRLACCSGYVSNRADSIRHRVIDKRVRSVGDCAARDGGTATGVDESADGRGRYMAARNRQDGGLLHPASRRRKLPDLVGRNPVGDVEPAQDVELVLEYCETTGQNVARARRPRSSNRADGVGDRVVSEDATCSRGCARCRASYTVDVRSTGVSEHAASHVIDLVVSISSRLGSPTVAGWIIFKWMHEIVACCVRTASAHAVKLPIGLEVNANKAHTNTGKVLTCRPSRRRATTRNIDGASHAKNTMHGTVVRISASLRKCMRINKALVVKNE